MRAAARLRDPAVVHAQIAELRSRVPDPGEGPAFEQGALDALRWVSEGGPGPLTGAVEGRPVSVQAIVRELATAEEVVHGRPSRCRDYGPGVEHALMWAQCATAALPRSTCPPCREVHALQD